LAGLARGQLESQPPTLLAIDAHASSHDRVCSALDFVFQCEATQHAVVSMLFKPSFQIPPTKERWVGALVGTLSGMLGGVSSLMGPILISYMMSLKLQRDEFVGCISVIYLNAAWPLYIAMYGFGRMELIDLGYSILALVPMALGLKTGQNLRHRLSEDAFRKVLLAFLVLVATLLVLR
jgi:uncharacterized membrane protein YfcA